MAQAKREVKRETFGDFDLTEPQCKLLHAMADKILVDREDDLPVDTTEPGGFHRGTVANLKRLDLIQADEIEVGSGLFFLTFTIEGGLIAEDVWKTQQYAE